MFESGQERERERESGQERKRERNEEIAIETGEKFNGPNLKEVHFALKFLLSLHTTSSLDNEEGEKTRERRER